MSVKYLGYRLAQRLSERLPPATAFALAERLADLQWRRSPRDRRAVQANLRRVVGRDVDEYAPLVREVFRNFGRYLVEFFSIHRVAHPTVHVEGIEHFERARRAGRGVIVLTGHLGNWEAGAILIHRLGVPVSAVALPHDDPRMDRLFNTQRQRCGVSVIPLNHQAARESLKRLREGHVLGILGDRDFSNRGMVVSCWGGALQIPRGPAILSVRGQAPVVPTVLVREGLWTFRLCFAEPMWPQRSSDARESSLHALTQQYAMAMTQFVSRWPSQWLVFQPVIQ